MARQGIINRSSDRRGPCASDWRGFAVLAPPGRSGGSDWHMGFVLWWCLLVLQRDGADSGVRARH